MVVRAPSRSSYVFFGARFPAPVVWLAGAILALSCLAAVDLRVGKQVLQYLLLLPDAVLAGQVWRLATWSFFELSPLGLIFGCLMILIFGRDLSDVWGHRRFLMTYLVITVVTGGLTTLVGLASGDVGRFPYYTVWPVAEALIIA